MQERVDLAALKDYAGKKIDSHQVQLDKYIDYCSRRGVVDGDYVTIAVKYYRKYGIPGRRHARGFAAQKLARPARAVAFEGSAVDLDQGNSVPVCFCWKLKLLCPDRPGPRAWELYNEHREQGLSALHEYYGIDRDEAKKAIMKLCSWKGALLEGYAPGRARS